MVRPEPSGATHASSPDPFEGRGMNPTKGNGHAAANTESKIPDYAELLAVVAGVFDTR